MTGDPPAAGPGPPGAADRSIRRWSAVLGGLVAAEFAVGIAVLVIVPAGRPSGWLPDTGRALYAVHALLGAGLAAGALAFMVRADRSTRLHRLGGRTGAVGLGVAGVGGLLAVLHPWRLVGLALMLVGPLVALFGYLIPALDRLTDTEPAPDDP